jgi:hypothetical protein
MSRFVHGDGEEQNEQADGDFYRVHRQNPQ